MYSFYYKRIFEAIRFVNGLFEMCQHFIFSAFLFNHQMIHDALRQSHQQLFSERGVGGGEVEEQTVDKGAPYDYCGAGA
jgi:hypothetical protein